MIYRDETLDGYVSNIQVKMIMKNTLGAVHKVRHAIFGQF